MFAEPITTFATATEFLQGLRPKTFAQTVEHLQTIRGACQIVKVSREFGFETRAELRALSVIFDLGTYAEKIFEFIGELFPILDSAYEEFTECGQAYIQIYPQGMNTFTDEDYYDLFENPRVMGFEMAPEMFIMFLNFINHVDCETWDQAASYFGWGNIEFPGDTLGDYYLDEVVLAELLDEAGMSPFIALLPFGLMGDNPFFTWNPMSEDSEPFELSVENVRWLTAQWEEAQEIFKKHQQVDRMLQEDPGYYARFLECWRASLKIREAVRL